MESLRLAFDALPAPTGILTGGRWSYMNPALIALLGRSYVGCAAIEVVAAAERAAVAQRYEGACGVHSTRWARADGSCVPVEVSARPIALDGQSCLVVAVTDLSPREVLEASFRALFDASPHAMFVRDREVDKILWANPAMVRLLGYDDAGELRGRDSIHTFVHAGDAELLRLHRERTRAGTAPPEIELRLVARDGRMLHVAASQRAVRFADTDAVLVIARDRTEELARERERREAEAALRESEARYRLLFDGSPLPICLFDAQTFRYVAVNDKMVELYGYSRDELLAMTVKDLKPPEDVPLMVSCVASASAGHQAHVGIVRHRRKDGALLEIDITSHQVMVAGRRYSLAIGIDVTEQRRIEDQLRQSQKMEAIGQLAGGVAHDFNNLLAVILSATSTMRDELGDAHPLAPDLAEVESAAHRAAGLTRQLLAFSRKQPHTPRVLSLRTVVEDVDKMLRRIVGEDIAVTTSLRSLGQVVADASQLEQVIMNLVVNARDAMPSGGRLTLETWNAVVADCDATCLGVSPGAYVVLSVADTGCGMDAATRRRIFEPFFTTKEVGRGTGLGLATVFGIVKQSGGGISVSSEPGQGTTFRIYLPRVDKEPATRERPASARAAAAGSESILVVEDDPQLSVVLHRRLRSLGYRTIEARDAATAVQAMASTGGRVDLLLTDLVMPGLDGRALATTLLREHPSLKVLFMSGYSEHAAVKTAALGPDDHFIEKPFGVADLCSAIRRALAA